MASDPRVLEKRVVTTITLGSSTNVKAGDLIGYSGGAYVKADADASTVGVYARWIATAPGKASGQVEVAKEVLLEDDDAPYTLDAPYYLSTTAGAFTATRPTTAGCLRQSVGVAQSTSLLNLKIRDPYEVAVPMILLGATSAYTLLDSGNFGGPTLDAQNETLNLFFQVPQNAVSLKYAEMVLAAEATAGTPTMDVTVSSAIDGAQWDAVTADATGANAVREGAAADEIQVTDVTTWFDATDIIRPGAAIGVKCLQDDAGTDISFVFGGTAYFLCV